MNPTAVEDLRSLFDTDGFFISPEQSNGISRWRSASRIPRTWEKWMRYSRSCY